MNINGLITVSPDQTDLIQDLIVWMGKVYETEPYTQAFLEGIRAKGDQVEQISQTIMRSFITSGAPVKRVYCTPDTNGCFIGYQRSEQDKPSTYYEQLSMDAVKEDPCLGDKQAGLVFLQQTIMWPISDFEWYPDVVGDKDYIHIVNIGVKKEFQHTGTMNELFKPVLAYAQEQGLPVFLETYSDELEAMYQHYDFTTLEVLESPTTPLKERCMMFPAN